MLDVDAFLTTPVEGELDTQLVPVPEGEYLAVAEDVKIRQSGEYTFFDIRWSIDDAKVKEVTGLPSNTVRQSMFLDLTESGGLDLGKGKNVGLGRLRAALGQNTGAPWNPKMVEGQVALVKVTHRADETTGNVYSEIKNVASMDKAA